MSDHLVPLTDIESEAHWTLSASGIKLNGEVRADWAGRPSVPADTAARLYAQLVEQRDLEARRRMADVDAFAARMERERPTLRGIRAEPGLDASALAVMLSADQERDE